MPSKLDAFAQEASFLDFFISFEANSRFANQNQKKHLLSKDFFQLINQFSWVNIKFITLEVKIQHWKEGNKCILCIGWKRETYCPDHKFWHFVLITGLDKVFLLQFNCCLLSVASNSLPAQPINTQKQCAFVSAYRQLRRTTWHICSAWYRITESLMNVMSNKKKELGVLQIVLDTYPKHSNTLLCSVKKEGLYKCYLNGTAL